MSDSAGHAASFWNARYADAAYGYGTAPNAYLASHAHRLAPGMTALVPADGEGRNGVWLAEQGLDVTTVDLSAHGVRKARALAAERGVALIAEQADLLAWNWPEQAFDVVASIYLHLPPAVREDLHGRMTRALRPGGLLVIEAFTPDQLAFQQSHQSGGPPQPEMLYTAEMLGSDFGAMDVVELEEIHADLDEGAYHSGRAAVVRGAFRKRAPLRAGE